MSTKIFDIDNFPAAQKEKITTAAKEYIALQDRKINPKGTFDNGGRFRLEESFKCCEGIRPPSRNFPYSELIHGRTLKHVCESAGVTEHLDTVRRLVKMFRQEQESHN